MHTHVNINTYIDHAHTLIHTYIYRSCTHMYIHTYTYTFMRAQCTHIYHFIYMHTILHQMCTRKRDFLAISLSVLPLLTLALRNEEWDGFESLHEVSEVSPSELSVSTGKQAGALRFRPDRRVIGLSTTLEVAVSVKASPSLTSSRSDSK